MPQRANLRSQGEASHMSIWPVVMQWLLLWKVGGSELVRWGVGGRKSSVIGYRCYYHSCGIVACIFLQRHPDRSLHGNNDYKNSLQLASRGFEWHFIHVIYAGIFDLSLYCVWMTVQGHTTLSTKLAICFAYLLKEISRSNNTCQSINWISYQLKERFNKFLEASLLHSKSCG